MKLPSHVLTKLYLAGVVGTVGAVATCEPARTESKPIVNAVDDSTPLYHDVQPQARPPQVRPRPKPLREFAGTCGPRMLCGKG